MLMESLAAGRGISLPAQSTGGAKLATRVTSAHAWIRRQFGVPLAQFEGVQKPLSEIFAFTYLLDALRVWYTQAVDRGVKPPVISAILKYYSTEIGRVIINHAMDVMGELGFPWGLEIYWRPFTSPHLSG